MQNTLAALLILLGFGVLRADELAENGLFSHEITLVNTIPYQQYGVCDVGKMSACQRGVSSDANLALFKTEEDNKVLFQAVPDPVGETYSIYADLNHSDFDFCILPYGSLTLQPEKQALNKADFKSSLSINAETGEMGNNKIQLKIDKTSGAIVSLKLDGVDHDLADVSGNGKNGLNDDRSSLNASGPKRVKLTQLADGPLVAVMLVETAFLQEPTLYTQITVFADSEKFKIENICVPEKDSSNTERVFSFAFQVPEGQWRTEPTYLTYFGENYGIDWIGPHLDRAKTEDATVISRITPQNDDNMFTYWLWPYKGSFSEEVASRFARKVQNPLRMGEKK